MLQYKTIYPATLEILRKLMLLEELDGFFLVGGTALALQLGHRISVDIDLFTLDDFDIDEMISVLSNTISMDSISRSRNSLSLDSSSTSAKNDTVEIDFIKYAYPLINPVSEVDGIRLLSIEDITAMMLSAITGRGAKKDFYDIFYLLRSYSLTEMLDFFKIKYPNTNIFQLLKSLTFFDDADLEPDPITIESIKWINVKEWIRQATVSYINNSL